jgi:subtilisin family serine protease
VHLFTSLLKNGTGYITPFVNLNDSTALKGNAKYTICDWVSSDRILCIGASVSKEGYKNTKGQNLKLNQGKSGFRAEFSSIGPTMDKRVKPDIAAPGSVLVSSVNSFDKNYTPNTSSADMVTRLNFNGGTYTYSAYQGTSMSSPVVTGSVALLLEAKPDLTPEEVIDLLKSTAIRDTCTSDTLPDYYWGYGKLNLIKAMGKLLGINSAENEDEISQNLIYPNPVNNLDKINFGFSSVDFAEYSLYDISGNELERGNFSSPLLLKNKTLVDGVYFIKLTGKEKSLTRKLIIRR